MLRGGHGAHPEAADEVAAGVADRLAERGGAGRSSGAADRGEEDGGEAEDEEESHGSIQLSVCGARRAATRSPQLTSKA